jgi:hypothetical protein
MTIPAEHALVCPTCGKIIDMRDLGQALAHGVYNEATGKYECHEPQDVQYGTSRKSAIMSNGRRIRKELI